MKRKLTARQEKKATTDTARMWNIEEALMGSRTSIAWTAFPKKLTAYVAKDSAPLHKKILAVVKKISPETEVVIHEIGSAGAQKA